MKTVLLFCLVFVFLPQPESENLLSEAGLETKIHNNRELSSQYYRFSLLSSAEAESAPVKDKEDEEAKHVLKTAFTDFTATLGF